MIYQELSGEQLPESVMISVALSGLKEKTRHFLLLHLDGDSSFGDLGNLLAMYFSMHAEQESSLNMIAAAASKEELGEENRTDFQENSLQQQQEQDQAEACQRRQRKRKEHKRERGSLQIPSLQPTEARGSLTSFPTARKELAETSQKKQKGKAKSQTLASSESLNKEAKAKRGEENNKEKKKAKLTNPSLEPTTARRSTSFPTVRTELAETS